MTKINKGFWYIMIFIVILETNYMFGSSGVFWDGVCFSHVSSASGVWVFLCVGVALQLCPEHTYCSQNGADLFLTSECVRSRRLMERPTRFPSAGGSPPIDTNKHTLLKLCTSSSLLTASCLGAWYLLNHNHNRFVYTKHTRVHLEWRGKCVWEPITANMNIFWRCRANRMWLWVERV